MVFFLWQFSLSVLANTFPFFSTAQDHLKEAAYWVYPYPQLVDQLRKEGKETILIFNYGSLMNAASAANTLSPASMATRRLGVAFGLRRLFDRDVPIYPESIWGVPDNPNARGMLNVILSNHAEDFVNGILVDVTLDDIPKIVAREEYYDLIPVIVQNWDHTTNVQDPNYCIAYTFHAPQTGKATHPSILPRPGYYELTRNTALVNGQLFYQLWLKTTFLSDGITPITEWEQFALIE